MEQYISKDALVAGIEKLYKEHSSKEYIDEGGVVLDKLEDFLGTLEVKEVDLEKETRIYQMRNPIIQHREESLNNYMEKVARHFFELGLKAQKGEW